MFMLGLTPTWLIWCNGNHPMQGWNRSGIVSAKTCNIPETVQDRTYVIMADLLEVACVLSIRTNISDLG